MQWYLNFKTIFNFALLSTEKLVDNNKVIQFGKIRIAISNADSETDINVEIDHTTKKDEF